MTNEPKPHVYFEVRMHGGGVTFTPKPKATSSSPTFFVPRTDDCAEMDAEYLDAAAETMNRDKYEIKKGREAVSDKYEIKKGVPVPKPRGGRLAYYPFAKMAVGDCFDVSLSGTRDKYNRDKTQSNVSAAADNYARRGNNAAKFSTRVIDGKFVRCWRIK